MNRYFTKRKAKKAPSQPKFELDLSAALPSDTDFRTSLIMSSLSKRFSMLRDQDDPSSMMGKASDDSVLGPRRQSRLMDFGYSPGRSLADIAEVSSIYSDFRPPFADANRSNSYISENGYGTDDDSHNGSIMSRPRQGEGNILFGGRQKIYKLAGAGASSDGLRGRALYDDDVNPSTFQRWKQEERERMAREKDMKDHDGPSKAPLSPSFNGSITRQTSSSTSTSGPPNGRTSTAATSIASQVGTLPSNNSIYNSSTTSITNVSNNPNSPAVERSFTKTRRLYDQGLNREIEEQQTSTLTRLTSIQKPKGRISPPYGRSNSKQGYPDAYRSTSPAPALGFPSLNTAHPTIARSSPEQSPVSPLDQFKNNALMSALSPNDRGKATAMGAFNKPQQFSEKQYLERQMTLRNVSEKHESKTESLKRPDTKLSMDGDRSDGHSSYAQSNFSGRSRAPTNASTQEPVTSAFSVFQNAASHLKAPAKQESEESEDPKGNFFFSRSSDGSSYENDALPTKTLPPMTSLPPQKPLPPITSTSTKIENMQSRLQASTSTRVPMHEHPAFKSQALPKPEVSNEPISYLPPISSSPPVLNPFSGFDFSEQAEEEAKFETQTSTLGLSNGGLSGLVRQHLRHGSNASSFYEQDVQRNSDIPAQLTLTTRDLSPVSFFKNYETNTPAESNYSHASNPFDLEDLKDSDMLDNGRISPVSQLEDDDITPLEASPKEIKQTRRRGMSQLPESSGDVPLWQVELRKSHARGPSAETIQEQDALSVEIAKRQRAIQERLRAKIETEITNVSPSTEERPSGPFRGLDMLRTKSSRESIKKAAESIAQSKPGRALGLGSSSERPSFDRYRSEDSVYHGSSLRSRSNSRNPGSRSNSRPAASRSNSRPPTSKSAKAHGIPGSSDALHEMPESRRTSEESGPSQSRKNSNPLPTSMLSNTGRSRSDSAQSNGRSRIDLEKTVSEGNRSTTQLYTDPASIPEHYEAPVMPSSDRGRYTPEHSQSAPLKIQTLRSPILPNGGYFESKGLFPPPQTLHSPLSASSATSSPRLPIQNNASMSPALSPRPSFPLSPALGTSSARASPVPFANHSNVATPPMSGNSTPVAYTFPSNPVPFAGTTRGRSASQKKIQKGDISEPRLISTTSVIDTVALPAGASLKNGMDDPQSTPPLPAMNPMRRKFTFGSDHSSTSSFSSTPYDPPRSSGNGFINNDGSSFKPRHRLRKSSSEGEKLGMRLRAQPQAMSSNPALAGPGPRGVMEGGMF